MTSVTLASNNGDIGGGEVMLRNLALAARDLGFTVEVAAPAQPDAVVRQAIADGVRAVAISGAGRRRYLAGLRAWDRAERRGLLWCNGLVPGLATAGRADRVLHLHQPPQSRAQWAASHLAAAGTRAVVCPSHTMAAALERAGAAAGRRPDVLWNWTQEFPLAVRRPTSGPFRLGFLGRTTQAKGILVLAEALSILNARRPGEVRLVIAGESRFADAAEQARVEGALAGIEELIDRLGWTTRGDFFAQVDLAVFPSVWAEPFGLVVAESQYARTPFVISDAGALPEVAGAEHPWVAEAGSAESLADTIERAMAGTPADVIEAARVRWDTHFSPTAGRERLAALLTDITNDR